VFGFYEYERMLALDRCDMSGTNIIRHVYPFTSVAQSYLVIITQLWILSFRDYHHGPCFPGLR
jgi:hypothetical protein